MDVKEKLVELLYTAEEMADKRCDSYPNCDSCPADNKRVDCMDWLKADCLLSLGVTVQEWIPVTERLPEHFEPVLLWESNEEDVYTGELDGNDEWFIAGFPFENFTFTHWMHLPVPPKGE